MGNTLLRMDHAAVADELYANDRLIGHTQHKSEIVGEVEIISRSRFGRARFTKTTKQHNELLIGGANFFSEKANNMRSTFAPVPIDVELGIHKNEDIEATVDTLKAEYICGMTIGIDGCVNTYNTVKPVLTHSRVVPGMIPFRKMKLEEEVLLDEETRAKYFLRVVDNAGYVSYYGKRFDSVPVIYNLFEDGTAIPSNIATVAEPKAMKHYTQYLLTVEGVDVREYFKILDRSTANSKISSAGLVAGYVGTGSDGLEEFYDVRQITTLNFESQALKDSESMLTFIYRMNIR